MVTRIELVESHAETVQRLAAKARREGVRLYRDSRDGRYYASSASQPGKMHYVTGVSCDCQGFQTHQRCMHHSALVTALGWTGGEAEPVDALPVSVCRRCAGTGIVHRQHSRWIGGAKLGYRSEWITPEPCGCSVEAVA